MAGTVQMGVGTVQLASMHVGRPVERCTCIYSSKPAGYITQRISKQARNKEMIHGRRDQIWMKNVQKEGLNARNMLACSPLADDKR
jgi:hypothetical protein